jgi:hypothetical protein
MTVDERIVERNKRLEAGDVLHSSKSHATWKGRSIEIVGKRVCGGTATGSVPYATEGITVQIYGEVCDRCGATTDYRGRVYRIQQQVYAIESYECVRLGKGIYPCKNTLFKLRLRFNTQEGEFSGDFDGWFLYGMNGWEALPNFGKMRNRSYSHRWLGYMAKLANQ